MNEEKYKQLKKRLREVIEENDSMSMRLERQKQRNKLLQKEKQLLIQRLMEVDHRIQSSDTDSINSDVSDLTDPQLNSKEYQDSIKQISTPTITPVKIILQQQSSLQPLKQLMEETNSDGKKPKRQRKKADASQPKKKTETIVTVSTSDDTQLPTLPFTSGVIKVESLGEISIKPGFHSDRYIYPVGFTSSRSYHSMHNPTGNAEYKSTVLDGGDAPKFQVVASDDPEHPIIAQSATGAWTTVMRTAMKIRNKENSNSASGPDYFGFSQPIIMKMIQNLPNASECKNYKFQEFETVSTKRGDKLITKIRKKNIQTSNEEVKGDSENSQQQSQSNIQSQNSITSQNQSTSNVTPQPELKQKGLELQPHQPQSIIQQQQSMNQQMGQFPHDFKITQHGIRNPTQHHTFHEYQFSPNVKMPMNVPPQSFQQQHIPPPLQLDRSSMTTEHFVDDQNDQLNNSPMSQQQNPILHQMQMNQQHYRRHQPSMIPNNMYPQNQRSLQSHPSSMNQQRYQTNSPMNDQSSPQTHPSPMPNQMRQIPLQHHSTRMQSPLTPIAGMPSPSAIANAILSLPQPTLNAQLQQSKISPLNEQPNPHVMNSSSSYLGLSDYNSIVDPQTGFGGMAQSPRNSFQSTFMDPSSTTNTSIYPKAGTNLSMNVAIPNARSYSTTNNSDLKSPFADSGSGPMVGDLNFDGLEGNLSPNTLAKSIMDPFKND